MNIHYIIINLRQQTTRERKITGKNPDITLRMRVAITGKTGLGLSAILKLPYTLVIKHINEYLTSKLSIA